MATDDAGLSGIPVDQLVNAVTEGVLRALEARSAAEDSGGSVADLLADHGIFGTVTVTGGLWPRDRRPPDGVQP
jgi:hypothetical protein